jgi:6-phosphogluconate dehydrogenase
MESHWIINPMEIAVIGLGRMGSGVAERLIKAGHQVAVYNRTPEKAAELVHIGARQSLSIEDLVSSLSTPRAIWMYLPSGEATEKCLIELSGLLSSGDTIIDGGNSHFVQSVDRASGFAKKGINFLDVGTSGGVAGRQAGYCLMVGGDKATVDGLSPVVTSGAQDGGFLYTGPAGSGHYVKMVHNAIEYGMMQAYGEGFELMEASQFGAQLDFAAIANLWQHGSIVRSYLGELLAKSFEEEGRLEGVGERVDHTGEGRWSVEEGIRLGVPLPVTTASLYARFATQRSTSLSSRVLSVLRNKFGGHTITKTDTL